LLAVPDALVVVWDAPLVADSVVSALLPAGVQALVWLVVPACRARRVQTARVPRVPFHEPAAPASVPGKPDAPVAPGAVPASVAVATASGSAPVVSESRVPVSESPVQECAAPELRVGLPASRAEVPEPFPLRPDAQPEALLARMAWADYSALRVLHSVPLEPVLAEIVPAVAPFGSRALAIRGLSAAARELDKALPARCFGRPPQAVRDSRMQTAADSSPRCGHAESARLREQFASPVIQRLQPRSDAH
jgi:hypothetical protein